MSESQKQDVIDIFGANWKNVGNLDYVCCWYKKAANLMKRNPSCRTALVATNSICQGEQVANLWEKLFEEGISLVNQCSQKLDETKKKIEILVEKNGKFEKEKFTQKEGTDEEK